MFLKDYIEQVRGHTVRGGRKAHYLFRGHGIPDQSENPHYTFVPYDMCPTPEAIYKGVGMIPNPGGPGKHVDESKGPRGRELFVNAQWSLGMEGSGAPVHFHNAAWSALMFGAKKWWDNFWISFLL